MSVGLRNDCTNKYAVQTFYLHHSKQIEANSKVIGKCHTHLHVLASVYALIPVIQRGERLCKWKDTENIQAWIQIHMFILQYMFLAHNILGILTNTWVVRGCYLLLFINSSLWQFISP